MNEWIRFPFGDTIQEGLRDLERHGEQAETIPALIVSIGAPKLAFLGIRVPAVIAQPERKLYDWIERNEPARNPHSYYNSLIRRLVSFEHACAVTQA
mgnify:CR=1 FL=1